MDRKKRPISPHLTIYKLQISSVLSILHRITGACLFIGLLFFSWLLIALLLQNIGVAEPSAYGFLDTILFQLFSLSLAFCLYYHLLNGIRHLFWDAGFGFEIKTMNVSGIVVVAISIAMTLMTLWLVVSNNEL